jgi:site-specific recombinase XerD
MASWIASPNISIIATASRVACAREGNGPGQLGPVMRQAKRQTASLTQYHYQRPLITPTMTTNLATQFDRYIAYCLNTRGLRPKTIHGYQKLFRRFQDLMPEVVRVEDLTHDRIDDFFRRLRARYQQQSGAAGSKALKESSIRTYGVKLYAFFNWLCLRGYLSVNPIDKRNLPKPDYSDKRALSRRDIEKLVGAITQYSGTRFLYRRDMALVHVLLFCGLRKNETLSLRVMDVDLVNKRLTVNGATSKSRQSRKMPITAATALHLEDYLAERRKLAINTEALWASSRGAALTEHGLLHLVKRLRKASGVRFHLHQFRHSFACMLGRENISGPKIQKLLGHRSLEMTQTYLRSLGVEDVRDSIDALSLESL